jgi:diguanylate cyclase (GGDEF)-like protein
MISLKKYIESRPDESLKAMCQSYRSSLTVMGTSATQICPHIGEDFQHDLANLRDRLAPDAEPDAVAETGKQVEGELKKWGERVSEYFQQTAHDVKEIMLTVAETTQALGERDQRYARQFEEFAGQLAAIGNLGDITKVRQSLGKSAHQLKSCVERMVQEGEQSVSRIRAELSVYQNRLDEVERLASQDPVTGVANRYKAERQIQLRIERSRNLSIAIFDLDNFKQTNDLYGHPVGDALLRQFAAELRTFFRSTDIVSRWGGDEFLVIVDCNAEEVRDRIEPVRKWVFGDYTIQIDGATRNVNVHASVGMASWRPGETAAELIARADAAMYQEKAQRGKATKSPAKEGLVPGRKAGQ